jgi:hypothetical protein
MKIKFLMAEEIRPEINNKASIVGLFPDDVVVLIRNRPADAPPEVPDGVERLSFLINVGELPEGVHKFKGIIITPSGEPYNPEMLLGEEIAKKGFSHSLIVQLKPFIVKSRGIYHFNFYVDDLLTSFPFEIR